LQGPFATNFYTRTYRPPAATPLRAAIVFAHGYLEHISRYTDAHARWAAHGIAIFTYDQRGFGKTALDEEHRSPGSSYGRTGGAKERMSDIEWAVKLASSWFSGVPLFLMGHSMVRLVIISQLLSILPRWDDA
jgi:acylglycerol lipase